MQLNSSVNIIEDWNEELGLATCILETNYGSYKGEAQVHPDDIDMKSQKTGLIIATYRARIKMLKALKSMYLLPQIEVLERVEKYFNRSSTFNSNCRENLFLLQELKALKTDLATINKMLVEDKCGLSAFIKSKEAFYQRIRKSRKARSE